MPDENLLPIQPMLNPLSMEDYQTLMQILEDNKAHADLVARCAECGLNMQERGERVQMHRNVAQKIIDRFFPTHLSPDTVQANE